MQIWFNPRKQRLRGQLLGRSRPRAQPKVLSGLRLPLCCIPLPGGAGDSLSFALTAPHPHPLTQPQSKMRCSIPDFPNPLFPFLLQDSMFSLALKCLISLSTIILLGLIDLPGFLIRFWLMAWRNWRKYYPEVLQVLSVPLSWLQTRSSHAAIQSKSLRAACILHQK